MDFRREIGQHFEPASPGKGFNFANLVSTFDGYAHMSGRYSSTVSRFSPPDCKEQDTDSFNRFTRKEVSPEMAVFPKIFQNTAPLNRLANYL